MSTATLNQQTANYRKRIDQLEKPLKHWDHDFVALKYVQISESSEECYHSFNELQMSIAGLKNREDAKKHHLACHKDTYEFLRFVENDVETEFCIDVLRESEPFRRLFSHYSRYCTEVERKYDIELDSEKSLKANRRFLKTVREYVE